LIPPHQITQNIRYGLTPLPFGTVPLATSYMLVPLSAIHLETCERFFPELLILLLNQSFKDGIALTSCLISKKIMLSLFFMIF
jgi:hypothetical protein